MFTGKHEFIKSGKFIIRHFSWFTMNIINHILLQLNNNVSIHLRHLKSLALEVFKSFMHLNLEFVWSYFNENPILYQLRKGTKVFLPPFKSFHLGLISVHFRGSILWNNLPSSIKISQTINKLKAKLKNLGNIHCAFGVCR